MPRRMALALTALTFTLAAAACGSDDDGDSAATTAGGAPATTASGAPETTAAPETTEAAGGETTEGGAETTSGGSGGATDVDAFCAAELDVEAAILAEDPEAIGPAFEALSAAAPEDVKGSVDTAIAEAEVFVAEGSEPTEEFFTAYGEVISYMKDNCGFNELEVEGGDYVFTGIPADVPAGPAIITFTNVGEELHELSFARINDDVTETVQELIELPEEEAFSKIVPAGGTFAVPGETGYTVVDFAEPGRYAATCFIPEGLTPEVAEEMEAMESEGTMPEGSMPEGSMPEGTMGSMPGGPELGPPHAILGMVQEFTVT
ncbi:MAG: hypothetical protein ACR2HP_16990 [Ilumatobacteraceae bacterium]